MSGNIRIGTYNTRGSLGMDDVRSTRRIVQVLRPLNADILCFQEIHDRLLWSGYESQPALLASALKRNFYFHKLLNFGSGGYGIGIASRVRPDRLHYHLLPSIGEQRGILEAYWKRGLQGKPLRVFCTHWGLSSEEREAQARACIALVATSATQTLFCGDLNEEQEGAGVRLLLNESGLVDFPAERQFPTYPADNPQSRIDYILRSSGLSVVHSEVVDSKASDHRLVFADIQIDSALSRETNLGFS